MIKYITLCKRHYRGGEGWYRSIKYNCFQDIEYQNIFSGGDASKIALRPENTPDKYKYVNVN